MSKQENTYLLIIGMSAALLLVLFGGVIGRLLLLASTVGLLIFLCIKIILSIQQKKEIAALKSGKAEEIEEKIDYCEKQIQINLSEVKSIRRDIRELEDDLSGIYVLNENNRTETEKLLTGFRKEMALREVKIDFFRTCTRKLRTLLHNHRLTEKLFLKKQSLQKLQDKNIEDLAGMESIKTEMAYESEYLQTINRLSLRMYRTESVGDAEKVHRELELITRELKEL